MLNYRIVIVDDQRSRREALRTALERSEKLRVVGEACDGYQATHVCRTTDPDMVLIDLNIPVMNGMDLIADLRQRWPHLKILALASRLTEQEAAAVLNAGAKGYSLKRVPPSRLAHIIELLRRGKSFLDEQLDSERVVELRRQHTQSIKTLLSERELQILRLIADRVALEEIARLLEITQTEVRLYRRELLVKLDAENDEDLGQWALELKLKPSY